MKVMVREAVVKTGDLVEGPMRHVGPMLPSIGLRPAGGGRHQKPSGSRNRPLL